MFHRDFLYEAESEVEATSETDGNCAGDHIDIFADDSQEDVDMKMTLHEILDETKTSKELKELQKAQKKAADVLSKHRASKKRQSNRTPETSAEDPPSAADDDFRTPTSRTMSN